MATRIELRIEEIGDQLVIHVEAPGLFRHDQPSVEATVKDGVLVIRAPLHRPHVEGFNPDASGV
jgi:hypothetical protein